MTNLAQRFGNFGFKFGKSDRVFRLLLATPLVTAYVCLGERLNTKH